MKGIIRVNGVEEAIACANDNEFGLPASVFGKDTGRVFEVAKRIESGICHVNGPTVHDEAQMPFGSMKVDTDGLAVKRAFMNLPICAGLRYRRVRDAILFRNMVFPVWFVSEPGQYA